MGPKENHQISQQIEVESIFWMARFHKMPKDAGVE
jgi:hypothetical protein